MANIFRGTTCSVLILSLILELLFPAYYVMEKRHLKETILTRPLSRIRPSAFWNRKSSVNELTESCLAVCYLCMYVYTSENTLHPICIQHVQKTQSKTSHYICYVDFPWGLKSVVSDSQTQATFCPSVGLRLNVLDYILSDATFYLGLHFVSIYKCFKITLVTQTTISDLID